MTLTNPAPPARRDATRPTPERPDLADAHHGSTAKDPPSRSSRLLARRLPAAPDAKEVRDERN